MIAFFSDKAIAALGYYVYVLIDPRDNKIFYVGKGHGNRVFNHINNPKGTSEKVATIQAIQAEGKEIQHYIIRHGLSEQEAFIVESILIDFLTESNFRHVAALTNIQAGHGQYDYGIMTIEEINRKYEAPVFKIAHKLLCININKTYHRGCNLYEITRKSWRLSKKRAEETEYVLAEYHGIILAVFKAERWLPEKGSDRYYFEGYKVTDKEITDRYVNHRLPQMRIQGQANPIRYFDK